MMREASLSLIQIMKLFKRTSNGDFRSKWLGITVLWPFLTVSDIIQAAEISSGFETVWKQNEVKPNFDLRQQRRASTKELLRT